MPVPPVPGSRSAAAPPVPRLPPAVRRAWERLAGASAPAAGRHPLAGGWWAEVGPAGGLTLYQRDPASGPPRRWLQADRGGTLHAALQWAPAGLAWARFRVPGGGWLELEPGTARHPLWGRSDRLLDARTGATLCRFAAQDYARLRSIPALDRPAHLPPGAGESALNLLAQLMADQGVAEARYVGPYPTDRLFAGLKRSFRPLLPEAEAERRFGADALHLALSGTVQENPVGWAPAPWAPLSPAPGVDVRLRPAPSASPERPPAVETVWLGALPYRAVPAATPPLPAGERVWPEPLGGREALAVGLVLLGEPWRRLLRLWPDGALADGTPPAGEATASAPPGEALHPLWREVLFAWAALHAAAPLAAPVLELAGTLPVHWAPLPCTLAGGRGEALLVQRALCGQYRALRGRDGPEPLAMMLVSDVVEGLTPRLRGRAQRLLEARLPGVDEAELLARGRAAQVEARARLEQATPALLRAIVSGEALA